MGKRKPFIALECLPMKPSLSTALPSHLPVFDAAAALSVDGIDDEVVKVGLRRVDTASIVDVQDIQNVQG